MAARPITDLRLFMFGPNQKSSRQFCNLVLRDPVFQPNDVAADRICYERYTQLNMSIAVKKGPEIGRLQQRAQIADNFLQSVNNFIAQRQITRRLTQFLVFVLVLSFGEDVTTEVMDMIRVVKEALGENLLRYHTCIAMMGGEDFERQNVQRRGTFQDWCHMQPPGPLRDLMEECQWRVQLFGGRSKVEPNPQRQVHQLVETITQHRARGQLWKFTQYHILYARQQANQRNV